MITNFKKSNSGVAAIEFAIILPFLLIVFYGVIEISNYILVSRKADMVANDIAYLLSREGCIAHDGYPTCDSLITTAPSSSLKGGVTELQEIIDSVTPFLLYPIKYNPNDKTSFVFGVQLTALPLNFSRTYYPTCPNDGIDRTKFRTMWYDAYPPYNSVTTNQPPGGNHNTYGACSAGATICPLDCDNALFFSNFQNNTEGTYTDIIYPGQAFITVGFSLRYDSVLGIHFPDALNFANFHKTANYAVRARNIYTGSGVFTANDLINYMYVCTDCLLSSTFNSTDNSGLYMSPTGGDYGGESEPVLRQSCQPAKTGSVVFLPGAQYYNSGGCFFN